MPNFGILFVGDDIFHAELGFNLNDSRDKDVNRLSELEVICRQCTADKSHSIKF
jgi:hypothetical protein